jgi:SAM-dependent methyltransferase
VGAGTGIFTKVLLSIDGLDISVLEPNPRMLSHLRNQLDSLGVQIVKGFCDGEDDRGHFAPNLFDVIASRQVVNELYNPLVAFQNWLHWLRPGGRVVMIDGLFTRDSWAGPLQEEVDTLPLAANQSMALVPYLLEFVGFKVLSVDMMSKVNGIPNCRFDRFVVVAEKPA